MWSDRKGKGVMDGRDHILLRERVRVKDRSHTLWKDRDKAVITIIRSILASATLLPLYPVIGQHFLIPYSAHQLSKQEPKNKA